MAEPVRITVSIDPLAAGDRGLMTTMAPYLGLLAVALFCAMAAWISAIVLCRFGRLRRTRIVALSAAISVCLPMLPIVLIAGSYSGEDASYVVAGLLPAAGILVVIALFVSAPVAWFASRRLAEKIDRRIFE
ncbi:hypothetical protein [Novosphingobium album (ex Hu et al. 2023)]|uniref:Uncharacterized protein n=1 Tax=Novosphingobium album (ex Hu et al. 2023) TaxID=2930093 RepID=A0ABT0AWV5_9SPHN|nr:hypothetical protein [Novosphingobium album (ex Hu et al. 2023)]MCJ2177029.1 hypothetical protein [Novosphingobium album (ex Hu et al. 2023)]